MTAAYFQGSSMNAAWVTVSCECGISRGSPKNMVCVRDSLGMRLSLGVTLSM